MSNLSPVMDVERIYVEREHREMAERIDHLHDIAGLVGTISTGEFRFALGGILDWIEAILEPHSAWEENWLYPHIDVASGTTWVTRLMRYEHQQIRDAASRLRADQHALRHELTHGQVVDLRGRIYALEALIRAHLDREEHVVLPLLDGLG